MPNATSMWVMRHGSTKVNSQSPIKDHVKGMADLPLSPEGEKAAHEAGKALQGSGITSIVTSQMKRSVQTGQIVASYLPGAKLASSKLLNPWDVGGLTGQSYAKVKDQLSRLQKNPSEAPPAGKLPGEPYQAFLDRYKEALPKMLEHAQGNKTLFVAHSRHLLALDGIMKGNGTDGTQVRDVTPPGTVLKLTVGTGELDGAA